MNRERINEIIEIAICIACGLLALMTFMMMVKDVHAQTFHSWQLFSSQIVQNQYGNTVKQCTWVCNTYGHSQHITVTQGFGTDYCPMPRL